jgi:SAM-dependent methyltransferase
VAAPDAYDRTPYTDHAYAESHPDRLAVVARLSSWAPPVVDTARVLELACARGGNLLPMAESLPGATLVGVDSSARQIDEASHIAREVGLANVSFVGASFVELPIDAPYDFVVAHGVCSWVAPAARRALLATISRALAPGGVAYLSFNVLPGWYDQLAARDWLREFSDPSPVASLTWLRDAISAERPDHRRRIDAVVRRLETTDPAYARHEYLADEHHPLLVRSLLSEASDAGLRYLGDAIPSATSLELLAAEVAERAKGLDDASSQQLIDLVQCTAFRRALFVREQDARARTWTRPRWLRADALDGLRIKSRLRSHAPPNEAAASERFDAPDGSAVMQTTPGTRAALHRLARRAPGSLAFDDLVRTTGSLREALRRDLLELWLASGAIDLVTRDVRVAGPADVGASLRASPLARWHAAHGGAITNAWHEEVRLDDPVLRTVLTLLDGRRSLDDVTRDLRAAGPTATLAPGECARLVDASVRSLAAVALLEVGPT